MDSSSIKNSIDTLGLNNPPVFFSYKDHFKKLWDFHYIKNIPESTILIEWDGFPDKTQNLLVETDKYITPIDWAVGYSLYINKSKGLSDYPDLRILIYDSTSDKVSHSDSVKFVQQSPGMDIMSMPWIRIFSLKAPVSGRNLEALFRLLKNLDSADAKAINSHKDSTCSTSMPVEEDKEPTPISSERDTPFTESPFLSWKIDIVVRNIIRLVNSFRVGVEEVEQSSAEDDTGSEPSRDSQRTQHHDSEQDTEICDELMSSMEEAFRQKDRELDIIKGIWAASLTRPSTPGDHHAIANLVGPLLLTEEKSGDLHVNALQALMRSIGLLPDHKEGNALKENSENAKAPLGVGNSWIDWEKPEWQYKLTELLSKHGDRLNLILIDDMFQISWGKILCRAVGVDYKEPSGGDGKDQLVKISNWNVIGKDEKVIVKAASSAAWIIKKLEGFDGEDKRFDLSLDDDGVGQEILFLDLRLYPGNLETEIKKFFEPLIELARKFTGGEQNVNLPWPGIIDDEIVEIQNWINNPVRKQEDPGYIKALTLLPRVLALTDLSLPIVLFSSTGRRDITEKLNHYGNIITVFEKPRFTVDIPFDIAWQTKCKFQDAMEAAFSVLTGRQICRKVKDLVEKANSYANIIPARINIPKFKHIEIYIDESGSPEFWPPDKESFAVGGLIMAYPDYNEVNKLSEALKGESYYWYSDDKKNQKHLSKQPNRQNGKKYGECAKIDWGYDTARKKLLELCNKKEIFISGICVQEKMEDIKDKQMISEEERHILLKDDQGDERYKRLLTELLELAIYEYIPALIRNRKPNGITFSIFAGNRTIPIQTKSEVMFNKHDPDDYFGYVYNSSIASYYTISFNSIHPIVAGILRSRKDMCNELTLHHARGVALQYGVPFIDKWGGKRNDPNYKKGGGGRDREKYYVRRQHYFADHVLKQGGINNSDYKEEFKLGFNTQSNKDTVCLLDARKELLDDNIAEGIIQMAEYTGTEVKDKMSGHLIRKIGESLTPEHFEGFHFLNILEISKIGPIIAVNSSSTPDPEKKQPTDKSKVHEGTFKLNDGAVKIVKPQTPVVASAELKISEETVEAGSRVTVVVRKKRKKNLKVRDYVCEETSGKKRRILVEQFAKKASGISVMAIGAIFEVTTYERDGILYGAELRRIDDKG